jgi:hypothetical protein
MVFIDTCQIEELCRGYRYGSANVESEYKQKTEWRVKLNLRSELTLVSADILSNQEGFPLSIIIILSKK